MTQYSVCTDRRRGSHRLPEYTTCNVSLLHTVTSQQMLNTLLQVMSVNYTESTVRLCKQKVNAAIDSCNKRLVLLGIKRIYKRLLFVQRLLTSSLAVAERPCDALCPSVVSLNQIVTIGVPETCMPETCMLETCMLETCILVAG